MATDVVLVPLAVFEKNPLALEEARLMVVVPEVTALPYASWRCKVAGPRRAADDAVPAREEPAVTTSWLAAAGTTEKLVLAVPAYPALEAARV